MRNFSLCVLKQDTKYARSGLFFRGMGSIYQTATKDTKSPSAKVIFLDATGGVTESRSGDVSERSVTASWLIFESYLNDLSPFSPCIVCTCHGRRSRGKRVADT